MNQPSLKQTLVVNCQKSFFDVHIGRGSIFGNPHPIGWCSKCSDIHDRAQCISKFREHFREKLNDPNFRAKVESLRGLRLGCFCKPQACHGDVILEYLEKRGEFR